MLYIISPNFILWSLYVLTSFTHFVQPIPIAHNSGNHQSVLCIYELRFFGCYCCFRSYNICLSLTYFTKHNALKIQSLCCHKLQDLILFNGGIFHYTHTYTTLSHFLYPFIHWQSLRLFPSLCYYKYNAAMNMGGIYSWLLNKLGVRGTNQPPCQCTVKNLSAPISDSKTKELITQSQ